jgi:hypothetical protein
MPLFATRHLLLLIILLVIFIWPWWKIFSKAGYPGWLALGMLVPLINLILIFYFAFADWPVLSSTTGTRPPPS